jgi:hypothetical protein
MRGCRKFEIVVFWMEQGTEQLSPFATRWKSNSAVECKLSGGVGGGGSMRQGVGLPVVVTFGLQQGSRTRAWCYDGAVVSSVGGASNGQSSGSTSATVAGLSFGSAGYSV